MLIFGCLGVFPKVHKALEYLCIYSSCFILVRSVQSGYRFGFGSIFLVFRLVKYNYHFKSIFTLVRFGLYTVGFQFIQFYTKTYFFSLKSYYIYFQIKEKNKIKTLIPSDEIIKSRIKIKIQNFENKNKKQKRSTKEKFFHSFIFSVHQSHAYSSETLFVYK